MIYYGMVPKLLINGVAHCFNCFGGGTFDLGRAGKTGGRLRVPAEVSLVTGVPVHLPEQVQERPHQVQAAVCGKRAAGLSGTATTL